MITSKDNPLVKKCIKLRDDKKERAKTGLFFVEGENAVRAALDEGMNIITFLYTPQAETRYKNIVDRAVAAAETSLAVSQDIGAKLADAKTPQGLFAVLSFLSEDISLAHLPKNSAVLILENLQDPGNLGTILRTALAFAIDMVVLVNCCDIYSPKVLRSTAGTVFRVPFCRKGDISRVIADIKKSGCKVYGTSLHTEAKPINEADISSGAAVIIGNEGNGVTKTALDLCDGRIYIPMAASVESLNASVAASICMWEMKGRK